MKTKNNRQPAHLFISYSRKDATFARKLSDALAAEGWEVFIDEQKILSGAKFLNAISDGIDRAHTFIFVVSPDSIGSEWCEAEVSHANGGNKRILTVRCRETDLEKIPPESLSIKEAIDSIHWVDFAKSGSFDSKIADLKEALERDFDFIAQHTWLELRARDWELRKPESSGLLTGNELDEFEHWLEAALGENKDKNPRPTIVQREFVKASRRGSFIDEANREIRKSDRLHAKNDQLSSMEIDLSAWQQIRKVEVPPADLVDRAAINLARGVYGIHEKNRLCGHTDSINQIAFSPDGSHLASASDDGTFRIWAADGACRHVDASHRDLMRGLFTLPDGDPHPPEGHEVRSVAFSPDGRYLATGGRDRTIGLWTSSGEAVTTLFEKSYDVLRNDEGVGSVAFSPDGTRLAGGDGDGTIRIWNVEGEGRLDRKITGHRTPVNHLAWSPDGTKICSAEELCVKIWDLEGKCLWSKDGLFFRGLAFSPDGERIAIAIGTERESRIRTLIALFRKDGEHVKNIEAKGVSTESVNFSPDGKWIAAGDRIGNIFVWKADGTYETPAYRFLSHRRGSVASLAFDPQSKRIASGGSGRVIRIWELSTNQPSGFSDSSARFSQIACLTDSELITAQRLYPEGVELRDFTGQVKQTFGRAGCEIDLKNCKLAISDVDRRQVRIVDLDGETTVELEGIFLKLALSPKGDCLATIGRERGTVRLWNLDGSAAGALKCDDRKILIWGPGEGGRIEKNLEGNHIFLESVAFGPDGKKLIAGSGMQTIESWDIDGTSHEPIIVDEENAESVPYSVTRLDFSRDGRHVAAFLKGPDKDNGGDNTKVKMVDLESREVLEIGDDPDEEFRAAIFHPGGTLIATSSDLGVKFWDLEGELRLTLAAANVGELSFSPDGGSLSGIEEDERIATWDLNPNRLAETAQEWIGDFVRARESQLSEHPLRIDQRGPLPEAPPAQLRHFVSKNLT